MDDSLETELLLDTEVSLDDVGAGILSVLEFCHMFLNLEGMVVFVALLGGGLIALLLPLVIGGGL